MHVLGLIIGAASQTVFLYKLSCSGGKHADVPLALQEVNQLMHEHPGSVGSMGKRRGFWGQGLQGAHGSAKAFSL